MPAWIHSRAEHIQAKNPSMPKGQAFAIATQQSHALSKSPKGYGTEGARARARAKYKTPGDDKKMANPGKLKAAHREGFGDELLKLAFATSQYSAPLNPVIRSGASHLPAFRAPQLGAGIQKTAIFGKLLQLAKTEIPNTPRLLMRSDLTSSSVKPLSAVEQGAKRFKDWQKAQPASGVMRKAQPASGVMRQAPLSSGTFLKGAEGAPTRGNFMMSSDVPGFRSPTLRVGIQKDADLLPEYTTYNPGDFKPVNIMKKKAGALTPAGRLAHSRGVGLPKLTAPVGHSIEQIAKPKGRGFGSGISGAYKTTIGGTAGTAFH